MVDQQIDHIIGHHQPDFEEEEAEEALSLCDLPLKDDDGTAFAEFSKHARPPPPPPPRSSSDFFEFFIGDLSSAADMCPAEDIIFCGKLVPFKEQQSPDPPSAAAKENSRPQNALRKRSESLSELQNRVMMTRSNSSNAKANLMMMRNSRSLDYRKLQRPPNSTVSPAPEIGRNLSGKSVDNFDKKAPAAKPRWYLLMFGMVKLPSEMELRDIKSRQFRRSTSALFPQMESSDSRNCRPVNRSSSGKGSWGLLRALSCKDHTSVAVTTSFGCMHQFERGQRLCMRRANRSNE